MEPPSMGVCFLDTCIILNKILDEDRYRTNKFFIDMKETGIDCYITPSVKEECEKKINTTLDYIGTSLRTIFQGALKHYFGDQGRDMQSKIVKKDLILLERIFIECYLKDVLKTPARNLENHIVNFIELKFKKGEEFSLEELILQLTNEIFILGNELKDKYDDFELMSAPKIRFSEEKADPIKTIKINQISRSIGLDDATHLSSMRVFETENDVKAVFVTSDYRILNHKIYLIDKFNIKCSNPLYAVHNF